MASGARKWLVGCGIGCGFMVLAAGGIGTCGYVGIKKIKDRADKLDAGWEQLAADYGKAEDYVPAAAGVVAPARVDTFLAVRDAMAPARKSLAASLVALDEDTHGSSGVLKKIRAGLTLVPNLLDFIDARNRALLEHHMGLGEYVYIYSTAYYAWLGHDPADGPDFVLSDEDNNSRSDSGENGHFRWDPDDHGKDPVEVRRRREAKVRRYLNRLETPMVANQLAAARAAGLDAAWLATLEQEHAAMETDDRRLLWQDDLPASVAAGFEPYRDRLEKAYTPVMNAVEMGMVEHD